jgi:5-carboxyvanillate decarboxylase
MSTSRRDFIKLAGTAAVASTLTESKQVQAQTGAFRRIATEETFTVPEIIEAATELITKNPDHEPGWLNYISGEFPFYDKVLRQMLDFEDERLGLMDDAGVDIAVLSLWNPGVQMFEASQGVELAKISNDQLAAGIKRHPTRYAGLAAVAPQDPQAAAQEVERAMQSLSLNGVLINSHTNDEFLDDQKFWPIFEAAVANDAPIYIHPRRPPAQMVEAFNDYSMDRALWGYAIETSTHALRLIMGGVFDQFPDLKIVLGHMGEGLPFWMHRLDTIGGLPTTAATIKRKPSEYIHDNFIMTTSGMSWDPALKFTIEVLGADKVMFAVDYPFGSYERDTKWLNAADISDADKALVYSGNAERVFDIKA